MKKIDMEKILLDEGFDVPELKWQDFMKYYKEKMEEVKDRNSLIIEKTNQKNTDELLERKMEKEPDLRTPLQKTREELFPKIVDLMNRLKGKSRASQGELAELLSLYNQFYLRHDSAGCGSCVSKAYTTFKKICRGRM